MNSRGAFGCGLRRPLLCLYWAAALSVFTSASLQASEPARGTIEPGMGLGANLRETGSNTFELGQVQFDKNARTVTFPAKVRNREAVVEYALVTEDGKAYESLLTTTARPTDIHLACLLLGITAAPVTGELNQPAPVPGSNAVQVQVIWEQSGRTVVVPLGSLIVLTPERGNSNAPAMQVERWLYNGSILKTNGFAAQREGSIISLVRDPIALVNNPGTDRGNDDIHFPNPKALPPQPGNVRVTLMLPPLLAPTAK